jgi:hypothetical protein
MPPARPGSVTDRLTPVPGYGVTLPIGKFAGRLDAFRYYERRGLLAAPARRPSGQCEYAEDAVADSLTDCSCGLAGRLPG